MQTISKICCLLLFVSSFVFFSCKKDNKITPPPAASEFIGAGTIGEYFVKNDANSVFKIPIGITNVSTSPRTITFSVTSPTGATQGQQYTLTGNSVVIPAGTAVDSISLKGIYAGYSTPGRIDTLIFTITGGDPQIFKGFETYKVVIRGYCDVIESQITGSYTNTIDYFGSTTDNPSGAGPYTTMVTNWVSTSPTTATANIVNLGASPDAGWGGPYFATSSVTNPGIKVTFDWTNPASFAVTIKSQPYFDDGSGVSTISGSGTFSACTDVITIPFVVVYAGDGNSYATTTVLKR